MPSWSARRSCANRISAPSSMSSAVLTTHIHRGNRQLSVGALLLLLSKALPCPEPGAPEPEHNHRHRRPRPAVDGQPLLRLQDLLVEHERHQHQDGERVFHPAVVRGREGEKGYGAPAYPAG